MACIYKINGKTFNTTEEIQNYVSSDEFVSVLAKGNSGISKEVRNLILNKEVTEGGVKAPQVTEPALRDVESTAKALEELSEGKFKLGEEDTPTALDVNYGDIVWQQSGLSAFNKGSDGKTYITDKEGALYEISKTKLSANNTFIVKVKDSKGKEVGNFEFKKDKDGNFFAEEAFTSNKGKGIAAIAYDFASKDGEKIKPSKKLKKDGVTFWSKAISEAYHKAKADGSNPELVKAVESLLSKEETKNKENAIQKPSTNEEVSRNGETRKNQPESSQGVRQGEQEQEATTQVKEANVKAIEEAITKKSGTIKNEIIKEAANPTEVKKILDNLDAIKSKLAGFKTKDGDRIFSEECKWG
jgi:hypothetical protein